MIKKLFLSSICLLTCFYQLVSSQVTQVNILSSSTDVWIMSATTHPYTNHVNLSARARRNATTTYLSRFFIDFDIASQNIPSNAIVVDAKIKFYRYAGEINPTLEISRVLDPWDEVSIRWYQQPSVSMSDAVVSTPVYDNGFHVFDITNQVQTYLNNPSSNYGWRVRSHNESPAVDENLGTLYNSRYHPTPGRRPVLEINYVLPIEITANIINHSDLPTSNNGSITISTSGGDGTYTYQWINGSTGSDMSGETLSSINNLVPGWYGVKVTDGVGNISYMAFVVGAKCGEVIIDFKPDGRFIDDTNIMIGITPSMPTNIANVNYGSAAALYANRFYSITPNYDYTRELLIRNRLIIPDNIDLNYAEQVLYGLNQSHDNTYGNESVLKNITEDWYEDLVTWNTKPTYGLNVATIPSTITNTENVILNLTNVYRDYQSGVVINRGHSVALNYPHSNINRKLGFASSDYSISSFRPMLRLKVGGTCMYAKPRRELDGMKYQTNGNNLYFSNTEEYFDSDNKLNYRVYNKLRGVLLDSQSQNLINTHGDNRLSLDVSSLPPGTYVLEIENEKEELFYLRFVKS